MHKVKKSLDVQKCFGNINVKNSFNGYNHEICFTLFDYDTRISKEVYLDDKYKLNRF